MMKEIRVVGIAIVVFVIWLVFTLIVVDSAYRHARQGDPMKLHTDYAGKKVR
jgi:succinate dehydrogenase hydrophobic anchor subunit